jgi:hypothetical protein
MIILYGEGSIARRYMNFLNVTQQFEKDVYFLETNTLQTYDKQQILNNITKVFICHKEIPKEKLYNDLIDFGFLEKDIAILNESNKMLGYILFDMKYPTQDHTLLTSMLAHFQDIQKVYSNYLVSKYKMSEKKYDIAFSFISQGHETHISELAKSLSTQFNTLNIFAQNNNTFNLPNSISLDGNQDVIDVTRIEALQNYDILISPNAMSSNNAISVGVAHGINEKPTNKLDLFRDYAKVDYSLIQTQEVFESTKSILQEYQHLLTKEVCLVPFGYPKLDKVIKDLKELGNVKKDAICYAPTLLMHDKEFQDTLSLQDGVAIVGMLLENFKEYKIIFRPHPKTIRYNAGKEYVEKILQNYKEHPNFIYDDDNYHIKTFSRTKLMISDFSGVVQTFAFATEQPVLSLSKNSFDEHYEKVFNKKDIRTEFGLVLNETDKLVEKVRYLLENQAIFKDKIITYREQQMFNFQHTAEYLADNIDYIKNGKKHPDWFYIGSNKEV